MPQRDLIVIGGSAGAIPALRQLMRGLSADFPAALLVVVHSSSQGPGLLPKILSLAGPLPAMFAQQDMIWRPGQVFIAPPDQHLLVYGDKLRLSRGPRENGFRPAVDPLFRSAARWHGPQVIGLVLSGGMDDGTLGLRQIKEAGGLAIVQDPDDALYPDMPSNAAAQVKTDYCAPMSQMAGLLERLVRQSKPPQANRRSRRSPKSQPSEAPDRRLDPDQLPGKASGFMCPGCGGALWELRDGGLLRYRCHVGHSYSDQTLLEEQNRGVESALWTAVRALEENAALNRRLAQRVGQKQMGPVVHAFKRRAIDAEQRAQAIREVLLSDKPPISARGKRRLQKQPPTLSAKIMRGRAVGNGKEN